MQRGSFCLLMPGCANKRPEAFFFVLRRAWGKCAPYTLSSLSLLVFASPNSCLFLLSFMLDILSCWHMMGIPGRAFLSSEGLSDYSCRSHLLA